MRIKKISAALAAALVCFHAGVGAYAQGGDKIKPVFCEVLMEPSTKTVLYAVNGDTPVAVGTAAKLMTVLLVAEAIECGDLRLEDEIRTPASVNAVRGARIWLETGEEMSVSDLLKAVIIGNANDAAASLAHAVSGSEEAFVALMNRRAGELGMKNTSFTNSNGYYDDGKQRSTAEDMAVLVSELAEYGFLRGTFTCWRDFLRSGATELVNSNMLVRDYDGLVGFKAGYTENAGFFAAVGAVRGGERYVAVVLGCSDKELSFSEAKRLLNNGFAGYQRVKPALPDDVPAYIAVKGGVVREIPLKIGRFEDIIIKNGTLSEVKSRVMLPDYVYAPVKAGDLIGEIRYEQGGRTLFTARVTAAGDAEKATVLKVFGIILKFILSF